MNHIIIPAGPLPVDLDLVFVIDVTGSMAPFIDTAKKMVFGFYERMNMYFEHRKRTVRLLRTKVITFRDYYADKEPLCESRFFDMHNDEDAQAFAELVNSIEASGGDDTPESALEALHFAINSDWSRAPSMKRRQVIVLVTDAPAHPLNDPRRYDPDPKHHPVPYPDNMPENLADLQTEWQDEQKICQRGKRLIMFVPNAQPWNEIGDWENTISTPELTADDGGAEITLDVLFGSISGSSI